MNDFTPLQKRVVLLGWITYAAYYLGRVNLAAALPAMERDLRWQPEQTSVFAGAILWTYAVGQLFNGWLGERLAPRLMVFVGILGSTAVNLLMSTESRYDALVVLTLINGFVQAMGWGPILRTLSDALSNDQRRRVAGFFGVSYIAGNTLTWFLTAWLLTGGHWQPLFVIPPLLMLVVGLIWIRYSPPDQRSTVRAPLFGNRAQVSSAARQFWPFLVTALIAGGLFNGALFYAPSFVAQTLPVDQAALTAIIFPVFGLFGTMGLNTLVLRQTQGNVLRGMIILLVLAAAARGLAFVLPPSTLSAAILLGVLGVTAYALTNMLLSAVPLLYAHLGTSQVAGLMDATHSIGGALGSTLVGVLLGQGGWPLVFMAWLVLPLIGVAFVSMGLRTAVATPPPQQAEL